MCSGPGVFPFVTYSESVFAPSCQCSPNGTFAAPLFRRFRTGYRTKNRGAPDYGSGLRGRGPVNFFSYIHQSGNGSNLQCYRLVVKDLRIRGCEHFTILTRQMCTGTFRLFSALLEATQQTLCHLGTLTILKDPSDR